MSITYKDAAGIAGMRMACRLASEVLDYLTPHIKPGVTTNEIDRLAARVHEQVQGAISAHARLPAARLPALPQVAVHLGQPRGLPRHPERQAAEEGRHRQRRRHRHQGRLARRHQPHVHGGRRLDRRQAPVRRHLRGHVARHRARSSPGAHLGDIGYAIQKFAEGNGFSVVREFCGHGIGRSFHEEPQVLHYGKPGTLDELKPGMTFTIEPMINAGRRDIKEARATTAGPSSPATIRCRRSGSTPCWSPRPATRC